MTDDMRTTRPMGMRPGRMHPLTLQQGLDDMPGSPRSGGRVLPITQPANPDQTPPAAKKPKNSW